MKRQSISRLLLLLEAVMIMVFMYFNFQLLEVNQTLSQKKHENNEMEKVGDMLHLSSDDLTNTARSYVITKDIRFKEMYFTILGIRNGEIARPKNYDHMYWDLAKNIREKKHPNGEKKSFSTILEELPFTPEERNYLKVAEKESNHLAQLEIEAFNILEGLYKDSNGYYTIKGKSDQTHAIHLLFSEEYFAAKHRIMNPIDTVMTVLNKRIFYEINSLETKSGQYELLVNWLIVIFIVTNFLIYLYQIRLSRNEQKYLEDLVSQQTSELINADKANQEIRHRLENAMEATNDGIWEWNIKTNELYFSPRWKEILGFEDENISPSIEEWKKRVHPDDLDQIYHDIQMHLNGEIERYSNEHRILCADGNYKWVLDRGRISEYSPDGEPVRMTGAYTDISDNRRLKELASAERIKYQNILKLATDGIYILKSDGSLLECSNHAANMLGYRVDELLDLKVFDWDYAMTSDEYSALIDHLSENPTTLERQFRRKDGSVYDAEITASKLILENEVFIYASVRDISDRNKVYRELSIQKREQQMLLSLFDKGDSVLFKWNNDAQWSIAYVSNNVFKMLGYEKNDFLDKNVVYAACIYEEDLPHVIEEVQEAVKTNADYFVHDPYRIRTKDGNIKWVLDYTVTQKDDNGQITHFIGYINDITRQKQFEQELITATHNAQLANESKSAFLANMSHEIRTPMNAILGFVEQLSKGEKEEERIKQFDIIKNAGKTLINIINDILDLSKIESGKMDIEAHPCNLHQLYDETGPLFEEMIVKKDIVYKSSRSDNVPACVLADDVRLKQVIFNLMSNAIKFTPEKGMVSFDMAYEDGRLFVSVSDTGIGIAPENLEKIFNAFDQEDNTTTRRFGGTGLGLSISSKLIDKMEGELKVESILGQGSRFFFDIPAVICDAKSEESSIMEISHTADGVEKPLKGHVLIVEDNATNQMLLGLILDDSGITYDIANNGVEAISMCAMTKYDMVFMDENMPEMNGIEATKHIRTLENDTDHHLVIIAVTANALDGDRQRFFEVGADGYVSKPYALEDIERVLKKYLSR